MTQSVDIPSPREAIQTLEIKEDNIGEVRRNRKNGKKREEMGRNGKKQEKKNMKKRYEGEMGRNGKKLEETVGKKRDETRRNRKKQEEIE